MADHDENLTHLTAQRARARKAPEWEKPFLEALEELGFVAHACRKAGVSRQTAYERRENHPDFAARWRLAEAQAWDALQIEARRRAIEGTLKPVYHQGEQCGTIREYSDALLGVLLKAKLPREYREETITMARFADLLERVLGVLIRELPEPDARRVTERVRTEVFRDLGNGHGAVPAAARGGDRSDG